MLRSILAGLIAASIGSTLLWADGINIPAPSWTYSITSLGTGVATALGINIGSAGAPVTNGGALGTPSSGVATNLTGTAASLTAGNVTTNANLTGEVTSVGNAATVAASGRLQSKMITGTRDLTASSGNVAYTGMGFTPTACDVHGGVANSFAYNTFHGFADSSRTANVLYVATATTFSNTTVFMVFEDTTGANSQAASIASYDADGLTLTWTKGGTPSGTAAFAIRCFR